MDDESIASAITNFSKGILEVEKMKMQMIEKLIDSEREARREDRKMMLKGTIADGSYIC